MTIRSFTAVGIPEAVRVQVGALVGRLRRESLPAVRWVKTDIMHLTLQFLGEVSGEFIESAKSQLGRVVPQFRSFEAQLSGLGAFPSPGQARVLWVGMGLGSAELCRVQASMDHALVRIGFRPEKRQFSPHLTLGRLNVAGDVSRAISFGFESDRFIVSDVVLFQSILLREGPRYTRLAAFPLGGSGAAA